MLFLRMGHHVFEDGQEEERRIGGSGEEGGCIGVGWWCEWMFLEVR